MSKYYEDFEMLFQSLLEADPNTQVADSGSDVAEAGLDQDPYAQEFQDDASFNQNGDPNADPNAMPQGGENYGGDADYMQDPPPEEGPASQVDETEKKKKLFNLMNELLVYNKYFLNNVNDLSIDMINDENFYQIGKLKDRLTQVNVKLQKYLLDNFVNSEYNRSLYIYILLRTEVLTLVKLLRNLLKIDEN